MKIVAQPIEMICHFNYEGINPMKFRYEIEGESYKVIKVQKVISKNIEKLCGNQAWIFECQSCIDGVEKPYQLKYFISEYKWVLWKI